jgi:hypothetical protein
MSVVLNIQKTQLARGFAWLLCKLYSSRPCSHNGSFLFQGSSKFSHKVSENHTSPTHRSKVPVFSVLSLCRVLLHCSTNGAGFTVRV